ncbi:hypothetical protein KL929_003793 [Ogataea haglerorum]|nr:hypothetical protein KL929_003793 [Ogataea haglerorum]
MGPATFIRPGRYPLANNVTSTQTACLTRMWPERQRRAKKERNGGNDAGRRADDVLTEEQQQHHMVRMRSHQVGHVWWTQGDGSRMRTTAGRPVWKPVHTAEPTEVGTSTKHKAQQVARRFCDRNDVVAKEEAGRPAGRGSGRHLHSRAFLPDHLPKGRRATTMEWRCRFIEGELPRCGLYPAKYL